MRCIGDHGALRTSRDMRDETASDKDKIFPGYKQVTHKGMKTVSGKDLGTGWDEELEIAFGMVWC